jgi:hypothetical protein
MNLNSKSGTYFGLNELDVGDIAINYPEGIVLRRAYAYVMQPVLLAFSPAEPGRHHPGPLKETRSGGGRTVTAELFVPESSFPDKAKRFHIATTIIFLLQLWVHPGVELVVGSNIAFSEILDAKDAEAILIQPPSRERHFRLLPASLSGIPDSISWTVSNFASTQSLMEQSPEFRLAVNAFSAGQFYQDTALAMVSLWGALEAIFSTNQGELRFRVSSLIAAYLKPPGVERLHEQKRIAKLYDKRSAAAHGKPNHSLEDLFHTYELLRAVLISFIHNKHVPTREEFEANLFGA